MSLVSSVRSMFLGGVPQPAKSWAGQTTLFNRIFFVRSHDVWRVVLPAKTCSKDKDHVCQARRIVGAGRVEGFGFECTQEGLPSLLHPGVIMRCLEFSSYQMVFKNEGAIQDFLDYCAGDVSKYGISPADALALRRYITTVRRHRNNLVLTARELKQLHKHAKPRRPLASRFKVRNAGSVYGSADWVLPLLDLEWDKTKRPNPASLKLLMAPFIHEYNEKVWFQFERALVDTAKVLAFCLGEGHPVEVKSITADEIYTGERFLYRDRRGLVASPNRAGSGRPRKNIQMLFLGAAPIGRPAGKNPVMQNRTVPLDVVAAMPH